MSGEHSYSNVTPGCCVVQGLGSLVLCQDLAGSWYAQRERGDCGYKGSVIQWFGGLDEGVVAQVRQKLRGKQWIAGKRRRQD